MDTVLQSELCQEWGQGVNCTECLIKGQPPPC